MSATQSFRFFQFLLRPAGAIATDALLARQWTEADPWHCSTVDPAYWLEQDAGRDSYILFDKEGPVFFWKGIILPERVCEMHIQFPPLPEGDRGARHAMKHRIRAGLMVGMVWLEGMLSRCGIEELYFDSCNPKLIEFATHHLKFAQEGPRLKKRLTAPPKVQQPLERGL